MPLYEDNNLAKRKKYAEEDDDFDNVASDFLLLEQLDEIDKAVPINTQLTQNITIRKPRERHYGTDVGTQPSTSTAHPILEDDLVQMTQKVTKLTSKNMELEGCVQMLKFKTENLEKEKIQLQATIIDVKNQSDKRLAEERALREKSERDLRSLKTTQDIDLKTKEFRERIQANHEAIAAEHQVANTSLVSRKVVVPRSRIGPHFPKSLADSNGLRHIFGHPKETDSHQMTFPVILTQETPNYIDGPPTKKFCIAPSIQYTYPGSAPHRNSMTDANVQVEIPSPYEALEGFSQKKVFDVLWKMSDEIEEDDFWSTLRYDAIRGFESNPQLLVNSVRIDRCT